MEPAARKIVVAAEAEYLRLAGIAVIGRCVDNLLHVTHKGWAPDARRIPGAVLAAQGCSVRCAERVLPTASAVIGHALNQLRRKASLNTAHALPNQRARRLSICGSHDLLLSESVTPSSHIGRTERTTAVCLSLRSVLPSGRACVATRSAGSLDYNLRQLRRSEFAVAADRHLNSHWSRLAQQRVSTA